MLPINNVNLMMSFHFNTQIQHHHMVLVTSVSSAEHKNIWCHAIIPSFVSQLLVIGYV